jgi:type I restriction enzyme, R subunit
MQVLDSDLPPSYDRTLFKQKSSLLYDLVFEYASKGLKWAA